ncbi:MAG: protein kinase [Lentisphaerae bacterium]|nr:protein kinase [Lentisphaerota bacterium]
MKKKSFKTEIQGIKVVLEDLEGAGGEGEVYRARNTATGELVAVKLFSDKFKTPDTLHRIRFLASLNLQKASPVLCGPIDTIYNGVMGHVAPWANGILLDDFLKDPQFTLMEALQMCVAIAHGIGILHAKEIAHGDIQAMNVKVHKQGDVARIGLIDFDNYRCRSVPLPAMVGQSMYMAPELREKPGAVPDLFTDRFELAVVFHEILLLRHPAAGYDGTEDQFMKAMCSGVWMQDRARNRKDGSALGGYPVIVLNPEMESLFRLGFSRDATSRPSPRDWTNALINALNAIGVCPVCGVQFIVDSSKLNCPLPLCHKQFPELRAFLPNGREIPLSSGSVPIGRADLNNAPKVSTRHVVFHKIGPDTWMTAVGTNPTFRWAGGNWIQLPNDRKLLVQKGDKLRLADIEIRVA